MPLYCAYCQEICPHFKALLEHYEAKHKERLKRFAVINRHGKGRGIVEATSLEEACKFYDWNIKDCVVKELV